jgi:Histidine kinase-, DNA gyrase B-, and HSP90-like ATPase
MKMTADEVVEISNSDSTKVMNFTIEEESHGRVLGYLVKSIYKSPISTAVRETMANARDANVEAGNRSVPLVIHLPNSVEPWWSCTDNGPGISPDRIENVFVKIGASTKRESNKQIGGFGIGAKSPWAYTDVFIISTVWKDQITGKKYVCQYQAVSDGNIYRLVTICEPEETRERTGTMIRIDVHNNRDFIEFKSQTDLVSTFMDSTPEYECGHKVKKAEKYENFYILPDGFNNSQTTVVIDGMLYPVNSRMLTGARGSDKYGHIGGMLIPSAKTGVFEVSLPRDGLVDSAENVNEYKKLYRKAVVEAETVVLDGLSKLPVTVATDSIFDKAVERLVTGREVYKYTRLFPRISDSLAIDKMLYTNANTSVFSYSRVTDSVDVAVTLEPVANANCAWQEAYETKAYNDRQKDNASAFSEHQRISRYQTITYTCKHIVDDKSGNQYSANRFKELARKATKIHVVDAKVKTNRLNAMIINFSIGEGYTKKKIILTSREVDGKKFTKDVFLILKTTKDYLDYYIAARVFDDSLFDVVVDNVSYAKVADKKVGPRLTVTPVNTKKLEFRGVAFNFFTSNRTLSAQEKVMALTTTTVFLTADEARRGNFMTYVGSMQCPVVIANATMINGLKKSAPDLVVTIQEANRQIESVVGIMTRFKYNVKTSSSKILSSAVDEVTGVDSIISKYHKNYIKNEMVKFGNVPTVFVDAAKTYISGSIVNLDVEARTLINSDERRVREAAESVLNVASPSTDKEFVNSSAKFICELVKKAPSEYTKLLISFASTLTLTEKENKHEVV